MWDSKDDARCGYCGMPTGDGSQLHRKYFNCMDAVVGLIRELDCQRYLAGIYSPEYHKITAQKKYVVRLATKILGDHTREWYQPFRKLFEQYRRSTRFYLITSAIARRAERQLLELEQDGDLKDG